MGDKEVLDMTGKLLIVDSRNRVTLPAETKIRKGDTVRYSVDDEGRVLLTPMAVYPKHQAWAHTDEFGRRLAEAITRPIEQE